MTTDINDGYWVCKNGHKFGEREPYGKNECPVCKTPLIRWVWN